MDPTDTFRIFQSKTEEGLRRCKDDAGLIHLLDELYSELDRLIADIKSARQISLACQAGCSYCCYLKVDASAPEILYLIHHIRRTMGRVQLDSISKRAHDRLTEMQEMSANDAFTANRPCPLLHDGKCSAYKARPLFCRSYHAQTVDTCKYSFDHPSELNAPNSQHILLQQHALMAIGGIHEAFEKHGYDKSTYDLGAALAEALDNPKTAGRWRKKKKAFSRRSYARDYTENA